MPLSMRQGIAMNPQRKEERVNCDRHANFNSIKLTHNFASNNLFSDFSLRGAAGAVVVVVGRMETVSFVTEIFGIIGAWMNSIFSGIVFGNKKNCQFASARTSIEIHVMQMRSART